MVTAWNKYGPSFTDPDNAARITVLRGTAYCKHALLDATITDLGQVECIMLFKTHPLFSPSWPFEEHAFELEIVQLKKCIKLLYASKAHQITK